jgi:hypothetical protein
MPVVALRKLPEPFFGQIPIGQKFGLFLFHLAVKITSSPQYAKGSLLGAIQGKPVLTSKEGSVASSLPPVWTRLRKGQSFH